MIKMVDDGKDNRAIKSAFPAEYARHYRAIDHIRFIDHATFDPRNAPNIIWFGEKAAVENVAYQTNVSSRLLETKRKLVEWL